MPLPIEIGKPTVNIRCAKDVSSEIITQLQYGIEEEGIPFLFEDNAGKNALSMAYDAAQSSRLEVGLGVDTQTIVLHYAKLPENKPLFEIPIRSNYESIRAIGANAGRLVKKLPLKSLNGR